MDKILDKKIHVQIGDELIKKYNIKYYHNDLYVYDNGVYVNDTSILEREILSLNENINRFTRKEILEYIKIRLSGENVITNKNYINFKNGLYNILSKSFFPHSSKIFTLNQINATYIESNYINQDVENFLDDITSKNSNRKKALLEIIGYSMTSNVDLQKAFIFFGASAENGKSTLLEILSHLIGRNNISHVSIHNLQKGKFYAAEIKDKLLNTVAELPRTSLESVEIFKSIVTGDSLSVEEKYKDRYEINPYAKHIFTANELPQILDTSNGFYRRLNIVKFDAQFTDEQKMNFNINNLLNENALNYLAKISLNAYLELLNTRHFSNEKESEEIIRQYKNQNNSINEYLYNSSYFQIFIHNNTTFTRKSLYNNYLDYCATSGNKIINGKIAFYKQIRDTKLFTDLTINGIHYFKYLEE